jgi:hypothetical protein
MNSSAPELVLAEEFSVAPSGWDGRPAMMNHPVDDTGRPVSANIPTVLEKSCIGRVFNTNVIKKELHVEGWIDVAKCEVLGGAAKNTLDRVMAGKPVEVSVGVFVVVEEKKGTHNGKDYAYIWRELVPDHLAFLEEGHIGACSNAMGCGTRAAQFVHMVTAEGFVPMSEEVKKRSLKERLKELLPFKAAIKGFSDSDVRDALRNKIQDAEPLFSYIEAVYETDGYFIYGTVNMNSESYEEHFYKRTFSMDKTGTVTLGTERTEVEPVVYFEPTAAEGQRAACSCGRSHTEAQPTNEPSDKDTEMKAKKDRIQALMSNALCQVRVQAALEALSEDELTALEETVAKAAATPPLSPPATPATPTPTGVPAPQTPATPSPDSTPAPTRTPTTPTSPVPATPSPRGAEEIKLDELPAGVRSVVERYQRAETEQKTKLVTQLTAAQKTYKPEQLQEMSVEQLEQIADLLQLNTPRAAVAGVDYSGIAPRAASDKKDYAPPDAYANGLKAKA